VDAPDVVTIACPKCGRRTASLTPEAVDSAIGGVFMLTGRTPPARFLIGHRAYVLPPRNPRLCRFGKHVSREWVDRARRLAESTGRRRLFADEVDRAG
jgi:hypothetical protein